MTSLLADPVTKTAARVANQFNLDPVTVAEEPDEFRWAFRVAAYGVIQADAKDAAAKQQAHRVRGSSRTQRH